MASGAVYELAFSKHQDIITSLGEGNAFLVWVMGLILDKNDLHHLASEFLTDSNNDKKIDFIYLDTEERRIVFSQGYYTKKKVTGAPANKASDLNTALAWISSGNVGEVPKKLSIIINDCRDAIENNEIDHIQLYYVHNLPESINVQRELNTIEKYHKKNFEDKGISISAKELGIKEINRIYTNKETDIVIHEEVELTASPILHESGPKWKACVFSMLGSELRDLYNRYGADLFSANYRGFLGTADRKKINNTIKLTAESNKENFWVYNNGITILTKNIDEKNNKIILLGISIINGAQTTGSIGNADEKGEFDKLHILCRAVETTDKETISRIVEYNNTQNVIKSWDRYSNNEVQVKIQREFSAIGHLYSTKRGENISDIDISIENVIQPLIAWLGDYKDANRGRNSIFDRKELYDKAFSTNALHILFCIFIIKMYR